MAAKTVTTLPKYGSPRAFASDAERQAWADEVFPFFEANGFVRTSDTGQFDASAVTASTFTGGYEIRRFDGPLQSTAPVFVKFTYNITSGDHVKIEIGTGSSGSGTVTGIFATRTLQLGTPLTTGELALCVIDDEYVGFFQYLPVASGTYRAIENFFFIGRTVDSNGDADDTAVMALIGPEYSVGDAGYNSFYEGISMHAWDYVSSQAYTDNVNSFMFPVFTTSSPKPIDALLMYRMWGNWHTPQPFTHAIGGHKGEWTRGGTVSIENVGTTNHTYRCVVLENIMYGNKPSSVKRHNHSQVTILMRYE